MTIKCIIIDDEPLARKGLKEYIADTDFLECIGEFDSPLKSTGLLQKTETQLLFLDIQMPKITGIEFFKTLQHAPPVIFTTAYPQYALEGFELDALDYLVKPISFDRFLKAALRAKEYYEIRERNKEASIENKQPDHFFIKADNKLVKIFFENILFVEALQNYVMIYAGDKKYMTYLTFKSVEDYLPAAKFIKTHKSYIVSAEKITGIEGNEILLGEYRIPVSRNLKDELMEKIVSGKFLKR